MHRMKWIMLLLLISCTMTSTPIEINKTQSPPCASGVCNDTCPHGCAQSSLGLSAFDDRDDITPPSIPS